MKTLITTYLSLDGGLRPVDPVLSAVQKSIASFTAVRLGPEAPSPCRICMEMALNAMNMA